MNQLFPICLGMQKGVRKFQPLLCLCSLAKQDTEGIRRGNFRVDHPDQSIRRGPEVNNEYRRALQSGVESHPMRLGFRWQMADAVLTQAFGNSYLGLFVWSEYRDS